MHKFATILIILTLTSCTKYVATGDTKLMCAQISKINLTEQDRDMLRWKNMIDIEEAIELNNEALHAWCEYEG